LLEEKSSWEEKFEREKAASKGFFKGLKEIFDNILDMPKVMLKLGLVQFFSWFAFFTMWTYATPAITEHIFKATDTGTLAYNDAANSVGTYLGTYGLISMFFALILAFVTSKVKINRKLVHMLSLISGGIGFISIYFISEPWMLHLCFALVGIAWASILSMPYAMLSSAVDPNKMGIYMGIFNMFIVIPQIIASIGGITVTYKLLFGEEVIYTMVLAGTALIIAGFANLLITDRNATHDG
jgi:maltose/moltooligosaccharide transporter